MPTCATRMLCSPTSTLWAIWTRLSTFVPRRTIVLPKVARSTVTFAPSSATDELADADGGALGDEKLLHDLRHGQGGVGHDDLGAPKSVDGPGNQQSSGPRGRALRGGGLAGHKGEITGTGLAQPGDAGDDEIGTSHQRSLGKSGDLFEGDDECRHG